MGSIRLVSIFLILETVLFDAPTFELVCPAPVVVAVSYATLRCGYRLPPTLLGLSRFPTLSHYRLFASLPRLSRFRPSISCLNALRKCGKQRLRAQILPEICVPCIVCDDDSGDSLSFPVFRASPALGHTQRVGGRSLSFSSIRGELALRNLRQVSN